MTLKALRWCRYDDKKWDLMNLIKDNTYEIIGISDVISFLPDEIQGYIEHNDFVEEPVRVFTFFRIFSTEMVFRS